MTRRELHKSLNRCVTRAERERVIKRLVKDSLSPVFRIRHESRKLLLEYLYGKPQSNVKVT